MEPETEETFEKRKKFLGHISYELKNMRECYFILKSSNPGPIIEVAPNLLIVAFSTHARNLIEFFKKSLIEKMKEVILHEPCIMLQI